jgi:hypothetical protein
MSSTLDEVASANRVDRICVERIFLQTSLSPGMVEAILRGDEPAGMSLAGLRKGVEVVWGEQGR